MEFMKEGTSFFVLFLGLITGIGFGLAIFKIGASLYDNILGMLRLKNLKILKFMLTAVIVASLGIHIFHTAGLLDLTLKPVWLWGQIIGGLIFGVGFALLGYCPGTAVVAAGEGKKDAVFGVLGGIVGAAVFAHLWPWLSSTIINPGDMGKITLSSVLHIHPWFSFLILAIIFWAVLFIVEKYETKTN